MTSTNEQLVAALKELLLATSGARRAMGAVRAQLDEHREYLADPFRRFSEALATHGPLRAELADGDVVVESSLLARCDDPGLSAFAMLASAGAHGLVFSDELTIEAFLALLALDDPAPGAPSERVEDAVTRLWKADLPGVRLRLAPRDSLPPSLADETTSSMIEETATVAHRRLLTVVSVIAPEGEGLGWPLSLPDDDDAPWAELLASSAVLQRVQRSVGEALASEGPAVLMQRVTRVLSRLVALGFAGSDEPVMIDNLVHLLETRARAGDLQAVLTACGDIETAARDAADDRRREALEQGLASLSERLADPSALRAVLIEATRFSQPQAMTITRFLELLPASVLPAVLDLLPDADSPEVRALLADAAVARATTHPHALGQVLVESESETARYLLEALGRSQLPQRANLVAMGLRNPSRQVQLEAARWLGQLGDVGRRVANDQLNHPSTDVWLALAESVASGDPRAASAFLLRAAGTNRFASRDLESRRAFIRIVGTLRTRLVLDRLSSTLERPDLGPSSDQEKQIAIEGLLAFGGEAAKSILEQQAGSTEHSEQTRTALRDALDRLDAAGHHPGGEA